MSVLERIYRSRPARLGAGLLLLALAAAGYGQDAKTPIDEALRGRIQRLDGDRITIRYDLTDPEELLDWIPARPFRMDGVLKTTAADHALHISGAGGYCHRAVFNDEVQIEFTLTPFVPRDLGAVVMEEPATDEYVLFSVNDLYFQKFDRQRRPGHMITRFGAPPAGGPAAALPFRYVARGKAPSIRPEEPIGIRAEHRGGHDRLSIDDKIYEGYEDGRRLAGLRVGIYAAGSEALVDRIVVTGRMSTDWIASEGIELRLSRPAGGEGPEVAAERAARALLDGFAGGSVPARDLLRIVADPDAPEPLRGKAVKAIADAGDATYAKDLLPLLDSFRLPTREHALTLVRSLVGKTFGYSAKASREKRATAIEKLAAHLAE